MATPWQDNLMVLSDIGCKYSRIRGHEDYIITENGEVYSTAVGNWYKNGELHQIKPHVPHNPLKYMSVHLYNKRVRTTVQIHRLVAEYFVPGKFDGAVVNHIDGNPRNNRADNLEWTTQLDNVWKSYETSGMDQTRNYKWWNLFAPDGSLIGSFRGNKEMRDFISKNKLPLSGSSIAKYGHHNGYYVTKDNKSIKE